MAYVPNNLSIFTAAFAGALAGMGASGKVISDPVAADYAGVASVAGAFAQAVDTAWGVTPTTELNLETMEEVCETTWQERTPNTSSPFTSPSNYTGLAAALIALVQSGTDYFTLQGIVSPPAGGPASQINWFYDSVTGLDTNPGTLALPKKTLRAVISSLQPVGLTGKNYFVQALNDTPSTDSFAPSYLRSQNTEDINAVTGARQILNLTLQGTLIPVAGTSTLVNGFTASGVNQAIITLASAAIVTGNVDQIFRISASADAGNVGATFVIGKDLGAGVARITDIVAQTGNVLNLGAIVGSTVEAVNPTKYLTSLIQVDSQGRYQINYMHFSPAAVAPADQMNLSMRNMNIGFLGCKIERPLELSNGTTTSITGCALIGNATFTNITFAGGLRAIVSTVIKNLDFKLVRQFAGVLLIGTYLEGSTFQTGTNTNVQDYGGSTPASATKGSKSISVTSAGLSVYNYPLTNSNAGILLRDVADVRFGGPVRGGFDGPIPAGAVGVLIDGSSVEIAPGVVPTIVGDSGGTGADIRITNPLGTTDLACRALQGGAMAIAAPGAVTIDAQSLKTWAILFGAGATDFQGYAFNPHNGGRIFKSLI